MTNSRGKKPVDILMVEDNPGDVRLTLEILRESKILNTLMVVKDGEEALDYVHKQGIYTKARRPDLILLDLNIPKRSGLEILKEIKSDKATRRIPVVILTSSQAEKDIMDSYDGYANAFVTKPVDLDQFVKVVQTIEGFWLEIVKLP